EQLRQALAGAGLTVHGSAESLVMARGRGEGRSVMVAGGNDARGLVYALLELADQVDHARHPIEVITAERQVVEQPANKIRGNMRLFASDVEDKSWYHDRNFWRRYLTMLATERFNRFSLALGLGYDFTSDIRDAYFHFAYPFLVPVPGYD